LPVLFGIDEPRSITEIKRRIIKQDKGGLSNENGFRELGHKCCRIGAKKSCIVDV
jgi:hypothetical protein